MDYTQIIGLTICAGLLLAVLGVLIKARVIDTLY